MQKAAPAEQVLLYVCAELVLLIADVLFLGRIKGEVADGGNQAVNAPSDQSQPEVSTGSAGVALGLQGAVINDHTADPAQEKGQQEANKIVIIHCGILLS